MRSCRRILRLLLIVGVIPAVLAAGLPIPVCACDAAPASAECACCETENAACCGTAEVGCSCCQQAAGQSCCDEPGDPDTAPAVAKCHCGAPVPVPATPASSSVELTLGGALPMASLDAVVLAPVVPRSAKRIRSALLPAADLPTTLCTLLI